MRWRLPRHILTTTAVVLLLLGLCVQANKLNDDEHNSDDDLHARVEQLRTLLFPEFRSARIERVDEFDDVHVKKLVQSDAWHNVDPSMRRISTRDDFAVETQRLRVGEHTTMRVSATLRGIRVAGLDRVLVFRSPRDDDRRTNDVDELVFASRFPEIPTLAHSDVQLEELLARRLDTSRQVLSFRRVIDELRLVVGAANTNFDDPLLASIEWHDALIPERVVAAHPMRIGVQPDGANLFSTYPPNPSNLERHVVRTTLDNVFQGTSNDRNSLEGSYFVPFTCCPLFVCADETMDATECEASANAEQIQCSTVSEGGVQQFRTYRFNLTDMYYGLADWEQLGFEGGIGYAALPECSVAMNAQPHVDSGELGFFFDPVDDAELYAWDLVEHEKFSSVTAFSEANLMFEHYRTILDDPSFCLRSLSILCESDGSPQIDVATGRPARNLPLVVNSLGATIDLVVAGRDFLSGRGRDASDMSSLVNSTTVTVLENAYFQVGWNENAPRAMPISSDDATRDILVFGQSWERDFAYDASVVRHELSHVFVSSMIPDYFAWWNCDAWGCVVQPQALNEALADFFASSSLDDPVVGGYVRHNGIRDLRERRSCPDRMRDSPHGSSLIFSHALWEIRSAVGRDRRVDFERAVSLAMTMFDASNLSFVAAASYVRIALGLSGFDESIVKESTRIMNERGLFACARWSDDVDKISMALPAAVYSGLHWLSEVPGAWQLRLVVPESGSVDLHWTQTVRRGSFGASLVPARVKVVFNRGCPIRWTYPQGFAVPESSCDDTDSGSPSFVWGDARTEQPHTFGELSYSYASRASLPGTPGETLYVSFVNPGGYLTSVQLSRISGAAHISAPAALLSWRMFVWACALVWVVGWGAS